MLRRSGRGVRNEESEFSVDVCTEGFEGFDGVERWLEWYLLVSDKVVEYCPIISSGDVFAFRERLGVGIGAAEAGREAAGEVGVEDPGVEFVDCVDSDRVTSYNIVSLS